MALSVGLPRRHEVGTDLVRVRPEVHRGAHELAAVVAIDPLRQAAVEAQPLERAHHVLARQPSADAMSRHSRVYTSRMVSVRNRRPSASSSATKSMLQMSLRSVAGRRCSRWTAVACRHGRLRRSQAFLDIHLIKALFADLPAFAAQQDQQPAVPEPHARLGELAHPLAQRGQRIAHAGIALA